MRKILCAVSVGVLSLLPLEPAKSQGRGVGLPGGTPPGLRGVLPPGLGGTPPGLGGTPPGLSRPAIVFTPPTIVTPPTAVTAPAVAGVSVPNLAPAAAAVAPIAGTAIGAGPPGLGTASRVGTSIAPVGTGAATAGTVGVANTLAASAVTGPAEGTGRSGTSSTGAGPSPSSGLVAPPLPRALLPLSFGQATVSVSLPGVGTVIGTPEEVSAIARGLRGRQGAPVQAVENCRDSIAAAALPYGAIRVEGAAAGPMRQSQAGFIVPITFNVIYARQGGLEARHATINCVMNTAGEVVAYGAPSVPRISRAGR